MHLPWLDGLIGLIGLAHAFAAYFYFSRAKGGLAWSLAWLVLTAVTILGAPSDPKLAYGLFLLAVVIWTTWWMRITAQSNLTWVPENAYQTTGRIDGDIATLKYVRNFDWRTKREFTPRWEDRVYDLRDLEALDVFVCTWGDPRIAHTMISFAFRNTAPLAMTIETRREVGEKWTALAGFMRSYELIFIGADERDVVRNRVNVRGEDVRLYRVASSADMRRKLFVAYLEQMNALAERPRFYNTIFMNCTTAIARLVRAAGHKFPLDWRILVSGYLAEFLYRLELLDTSLPFQQLRAAADIRDRSRAADGDPDYWRRIREGLPNPNKSAAPARVAVPH